MADARKIFYLLDRVVNSKKNLADSLADKGEDASNNEPLDDLVKKAGDYIPKSYLFVDENGNEVAGILVSQETVFDATVNDVREGKTFGAETGVATGEKVIPGCHSHEGTKRIRPGQKFEVSLVDENQYDYTLLQCVICAFNTNLVDSVAAEKVVINDTVYDVLSTIPLYAVTKNHETHSINLGFTNDTDEPLVLRYFTYKEIY